MSRSTQGEPGAPPKRSRSAASSAGSRPGSSRRASEDRYRKGARRTKAQPLAASWRPDPTGLDAVDRELADRPRSRRRGFLATYGWRVVALPVLLVVTVLVMIKTTGRGPNPDAANTAATAQNGLQSDGSTAEQPKATEVPQQTLSPDVPTAQLPGGGSFAQHGKGTWHVVAGTGKRVGTRGRLYTYTVEIEDGINAASYGGDQAFAELVDQTLADPRSWTGDGDVSVQRVDPKVTTPDIRISLTTPDTTHRADYCGNSIHYESSCWRSSQGRVVINLARWVRGALAFNGDMLTYRQYALNHEIGHAFGNHHLGCRPNGGLAPVMMQQTFGVSNDYVARLNQVDPTNKDAVPTDHKVCKVNAWPNPQAKTG